MYIYIYVCMYIYRAGDPTGADLDMTNFHTHLRNGFTLVGFYSLIGIYMVSLSLFIYLYLFLSVYPSIYIYIYVCVCIWPTSILTW